MSLKNQRKSGEFMELKDNDVILEVENFLTLILLKFFLRFSSFSKFVPDPNILALSDENFFTKAPPIPPVAPVIKTFLFFKSIIINF